MAIQNTEINRTDYQNNILRLEKKYFEKIEQVITSDGFQNDLLLIEKETEENYPRYRDVWKLVDKIKVPVERLIRQHIYLSFANEITGIYPSPISSDLGIRMADAVICIDAKTINTYSNAGDLRSTHAEQNQNSFDNRNYQYIKVVSNLEAIDHYSRLPVLTYIIKVVYNDDKYHFKLERNPKPSMVLVCIPNGELSSLFDYNIIDNFKTYKYYDETDGEYYKPINVNNIPDGILNDYLTEECINRRHWLRVDTEQFSSDHIFYDIARQQLWWLTSYKNKNCVVAVKSGDTVRYNNNIMRNRFDEYNNCWEGYKEYQLPAPLPSAAR